MNIAALPMPLSLDGPDGVTRRHPPQVDRRRGVGHGQGRHHRSRRALSADQPTANGYASVVEPQPSALLAPLLVPALAMRLADLSLD